MYLSSDTIAGFCNSNNGMSFKQRQPRANNVLHDANYVVAHRGLVLNAMFS